MLCWTVKGMFCGPVVGVERHWAVRTGKVILNVGRRRKASQEGDTGTEIRRKGENHAVNQEKNFSSGTVQESESDSGLQESECPVNSQDPSACALTFSPGFQKVVFNHWRILEDQYSLLGNISLSQQMCNIFSQFPKLFFEFVVFAHC